MAAVGALLISSGIALMAAPTTASAAQFKHTDPQKVVVCKYVGTPPGVLDHVIIVSVNSMPKGFSGTFPYAWTDAHGKAGGSKAIRWAADKEQAKDVSLSECGSQPELLQAVAKAVPVPATCAANVPSYSTTGSVGVAKWDESAAPAFGTTITLTAHAADGYTFNGKDTATVSVTFGTAATGCTNVSPPTTPQVSPPKAHVKTKAKAETTTTSPTVVEAGLPGTGGTGAEAGLALTLAGLALLAGAGGLVLVEGGERK